MKKLYGMNNPYAVVSRRLFKIMYGMQNTENLTKLAFITDDLVDENYLFKFMQENFSQVSNDEEILKNIFTIRMITLEDVYIKLIKEKDKLYLQLFDEEIFEERIELKDFGNINKKDLEIKINKKIKIFN